MNISYSDTDYYSWAKLGLFFLFATLNFQLFGSNSELENKSGFGLKSISFVQESIKVGRSNETVFFSVRAYSQLGLNKVIIYLTSPSGNEKIEVSCINKKKTKAGLLLGRILFKKKSELGKWVIDKITIEDIEGNKESVDKDFLIQNKFTYSLLVKE